MNVVWYDVDSIFKVLGLFGVEIEVVDVGLLEGVEDDFFSKRFILLLCVVWLWFLLFICVRFLVVFDNVFVIVYIVF